MFFPSENVLKFPGVQTLLDKHHHQIQIEWLPPYSPELNPQEDLWQELRRCVTHNHYFEHIGALLEAVREFHQHLDSDPIRAIRLLKKWAKLISV